VKISCVICLECGTILFSKNAHDYRTCDCPNSAMIDGGPEYLRCGAANLQLIDSGMYDPESGTFEARWDSSELSPSNRVSRWPY